MLPQHSFVAFLPYAPLLLKALKPKELDPEPGSLGEHVKRRRLKAKLTQRQAAERMSVNPWTVLNWENQKTEPARRLIPAILRFLAPECGSTRAEGQSSPRNCKRRCGRT